MKYPVTEIDKYAILQPTTKYKYRIFIQDSRKNILKIINEITLSSYEVDSDSSARRRVSVTIHGINDIDKFLNLYMRMNFVFSIGVFSDIKSDYIWYPCGTLVLSDASTTYDATTKSLSSTLMDWYCKMDGTRNGQVGGAPTIVISTKDSKGNAVTIQAALRNFILSEGITKDIIIEDIGEFYGQQATNPTGYAEYRKNNPKWNTLPYDLEFSASDTQATIVQKIAELYPNVETYFDVYNNFCCNMIPSCENDSIVLNDEFFKKILLSEDTESTTYSIGNIKNVTEVFGKIYEVDRTSETCTYSSNVYTLSLTSYTSYTYAIIAFTPKVTNGVNPKIRINSLSAIPLYNEYTTTYVSANTLIANEMNVIMIRMLSNGNFVAYYLGQYQPHALCVLTDNANDVTYTKKYFQDKYNCNNVTLRVEKGSPYTVQKLGEILDVKSGEDYDNILSDSLASQNAIYQNKISSSLNETIEISTKMIPWLDVNTKVEYKKQTDETPNQYIVKNVSHDLESCKTKISLQKFYPLYYG